MPPAKAGGFFVLAWCMPPHRDVHAVPDRFVLSIRDILRRIVELLFYLRTPSPVGPLFLAASAKGLVRLEFEGRELKLDRHSIQLQESSSALSPYLQELNQYFAGERREFSFPLDLRGTAFQLACWHALLKIPYGETRSYRDIAQAIGHPHAYRAVGMSNNRNPVAIIVPCHRVIASSGSLCGYGGGLDTKRQLLDLECAKVGPGRHPYLPLGMGA
jgi:O-6-methylguanine DNA methyltransferase